MDESLFIEPIGSASAHTAVIDESLFIDSPAARALSPEPRVSASSAFSVPTIASLERGKYYVQLGAFSKTETVESEINRIGSAYPLAVQSAGSGEKPVYRILLGPMNQGESGAILQRFKSIGYSDAFVRTGG
jgi:cell division septation protein DedD